MQSCRFVYILTISTWRNLERSHCVFKLAKNSTLRQSYPCTRVLDHNWSILGQSSSCPCRSRNQLDPTSQQQHLAHKNWLQLFIRSHNSIPTTHLRSRPQYHPSGLVTTGEIVKPYLTFFRRTTNIHVKVEIYYTVDQRSRRLSDVRRRSNTVREDVKSVHFVLLETLRLKVTLKYCTCTSAKKYVRGSH